MDKPPQSKWSKRKRWLAALTTVALFGIMLIALNRRDDGPIYEGKPLRYWIEQLNEKKDTAGKEAAQVIRRARVSAVPYLLKIHTASDSPNNPHKDRMWSRLRRSIPLADDLLPTKQSLWPQTVEALSEIGPDAIPLIIPLYESKEPHVRKGAIFLLGLYENSARLAVPVLLRAANDSDPMIRYHAAMAMRDMDDEADRFLPVLLQLIAEDDRYISGMAAWALRKYGDKAKPAIPQLIELLQSTNSLTISRSETVLKEIAPDVLESAAKDKTDEQTR